MSLTPLEAAALLAAAAALATALAFLAYWPSRVPGRRFLNRTAAMQRRLRPRRRPGALSNGMPRLVGLVYGGQRRAVVLHHAHEAGAPCTQYRGRDAEGRVVEVAIFPRGRHYNEDLFPYVTQEIET